MYRLEALCNYYGRKSCCLQRNTKFDMSSWDCKEAPLYSGAFDLIGFPKLWEQGRTSIVGGYFSGFSVWNCALPCDYGVASGRLSSVTQSGKCNSIIGSATKFQVGVFKVWQDLYM